MTTATATAAQITEVLTTIASIGGYGFKLEYRDANGDFSVEYKLHTKGGKSEVANAGIFRGVWNVGVNTEMIYSDNFENFCDFVKEIRKNDFAKTSNARFAQCNKAIEKLTK